MLGNILKKLIKAIWLLAKAEGVENWEKLPEIHVRNLATMSTASMGMPAEIIKPGSAMKSLKRYLPLISILFAASIGILESLGLKDMANTLATVFGILSPESAEGSMITALTIAAIGALTKFAVSFKEAWNKAVSETK